MISEIFEAGLSVCLPADRHIFELPTVGVHARIVAAVCMKYDFPPIQNSNYDARNASLEM
jgi:hypothetical protein